MTAILRRPVQTGAERQESAPVMPKQAAGPLPRAERNEPRRGRSLPGLAWRQFRRVPATACFLAAVWGAGLVTGNIAHGPRWLSGHAGAGAASLGHGYWWIPLRAALLPSGLDSYLVVTVLGLVILVPAEHRMGAARTFTTLLASQAAGLLLAAGLVKLAHPARGPWLYVFTRETAVDVLPGVLGVGFALSCTLAPRWRRRLRLLLAVATATGVLYIGHLEQVAQACGAASGLVITALTYGRARSGAEARASRHEIRALVALLVAVPALGDMLAALVANAHGPMPLSSLLFATPGPDPQDLVANQWPGVLVYSVPALLLLVSAYGLRRGHRLAWWLAVAINLTVLGVSVWVACALESGPGAHVDGLAAGTRATTPAWEAMFLAVVTLAVLLATRRRFDQAAERRAVRKLTATGAAALSVSFVVFLLAGYLPESLAGRVLYVWAFLPPWVVILGALTAFFLHTGAYRDAGAADRARAILMRGGSTLSYMSTWRGNRYWFSSDGRSAVAYRAIAGVAVTVGEPYGDPAALDSAITEFARFCDLRSLQPCLYSVTERTRAVTERLGWKSVQVAEDALLPLACLRFAGKKWQNVRNAVNKAAREGITAEWWSYPDAPVELVDQIRQISGKWVADKGLPEMGFTLGGLEELNDPNVRCLIAVGADRRVHAVTSWLPVYERGCLIGWTLDLMRRNVGPDTSHGVMEFLIATAARTFQEEGARFVSLSGAPLARLDRGQPPCAVQRLLDVLANAMEPVYGFQSLLQFKDKFHPVYQPLYLTYPDPAAIGSIATAIGRAYLPDLTSRQALRLFTKLRWSWRQATPA
jgi:phosphatidylglycerol lysyltransferase